MSTGCVWVRERKMNKCAQKERKKEKNKFKVWNKVSNIVAFILLPWWRGKSVDSSPPPPRRGRWCGFSHSSLSTCILIDGVLFRTVRSLCVLLCITYRSSGNICCRGERNAFAPSRIGEAAGRENKTVTVYLITAHSVHARLLKRIISYWEWKE